jgi:alanyl-tRNA synthetase
MTVRELREKYLAFFESKGHRRFPSGSLVPIDVTGKRDESLLFNGAGMIQFKPYFRGIAKPDHPRLTTVQKCVRTNDIDEVGDATHLSFFEMLGNFSFGDYFKNQAIDYSWEFLTSPEWLGLDPTKLAFTIFETDEDAYAAWSLHLNSKDIDPETRVFRLDEETNYWPAGAFSKGPPGPCGPNSEMFYWTADTPPPTGAYGREDFLRDDAAGNWVEIWNDVFIQYEWQGHPDPSGKGYVKDGMPELPFRSIDTGMGLDRTAFVLAGKKSVYENGSFDGVFRILNELTGDGLDYATDASPKGQAARIIADHVRNATFCISDGIVPGNNGRGYVVKRLIRRAILKGQRTLGLSEPFLYKAFEGVVETMGDFYTELEERRATIVETLRNEEEAFRRTLNRGLLELMSLIREIIGEEIRELAVLPGLDSASLDGRVARIVSSFPEVKDPLDISASQLMKPFATIEDVAPDLISLTNLRLAAQKDMAAWGITHTRPIKGRRAFLLYGTFGFPLEVTQEIAAEVGIDVDLEGYEKAFKEDQALARGAQGEKSAYGDVNVAEEQAIENAPSTTEFTGYCESSGTGRIVRVRPIGRKAPGSPPPTPSSSPDETSDSVGGSGRGDKEGALRVLVALDTTPFYAASGGQVGDTGMLTLGDGSVFHVKDTTKEGGTFWHNLGSVDADLLGKTVTAQVDANRRRKIQRNHTATHLLQAALREILGGHVTQAGSLVDPERLRFDFAHGKALTPQEIETVERRVVERILANEDVITYADLPIAEAKARGAMALFGEKYGDRVRMVEVGEFSRELCGGIHVRTAGEIGGFRIVSESSAAGGVRRIEAVTGEAAYELARQETQRIREAASLLKASPAELVQAVERTIEAAKEAKRKQEKAERAVLSGEGGGAETVDVNGVALWRRDFGDVDPKTAASAVDDAAAQAPNQVTLAAVVSGGKIQFIAKAGADAVAKGAHAGNLLREVARIAGGGGGGQAQFATAGGRDPAKVAEALAVAEAVLRGQIK